MSVHLSQPADRSPPPNSLDQKASEHSLELSQKLGKLTEAVSENRRQFTSICDGMDTKFSDRIAM